MKVGSEASHVLDWKSNSWPNYNIFKGGGAHLCQRVVGLGRDRGALRGIVVLQVKTFCHFLHAKWREVVFMYSSVHIWSPKVWTSIAIFHFFLGGGGGWGKARVPQDYVPAANAGRIVLHNTFFQFCRLNSSTPSKCEGLTNMISGCPMKGVLV